MNGLIRVKNVVKRCFKGRKRSDLDRGRYMKMVIDRGNKVLEELEREIKIVTPTKVELQEVLTNMFKRRHFARICKIGQQWRSILF